ncbi:MAG TPA: hypothetical protein VFZ76_13890, partial [Anaerolineales bacterium]
MLSLKEKVRLLLDNLSLELERGVRCLEVVKAIKFADPREEVRDESTFFITVHEACQRGALLSLAKLVIAEKESISVDYLLNCALEVPSKAFPHASRDTLEAAVSGHRGQLAGLATLSEDLKARRDRMLAHLDRKHVNEPEVLPSGAIDLEVIEEGYETVSEIITAYRGYFGMPALSLEEMRAGLIEEVAEL